MTPREGWTELLLRESWHWSATFTFRPRLETARAGVHPEAADKAFRFFVHSLNRQLYGKKWRKHPSGGVVWARGQEFHKDGRIHFHALFACVETDLNEVARRLDWMDWWFEKFGIARIERPISQNAVAAYITKYIVKGGEVDVSDNFGRVHPPQLNFDAPGEESAPGE